MKIFIILGLQPSDFVIGLGRKPQCGYSESGCNRASKHAIFATRCENGIFKLVWQKRGDIMSKGGVSGNTHTQEQLDNYANQNNPNNPAYQDNLDNHADQLNPNNDEHKESKK
jgi:hypothetical protein